ncbi:MAG: ABC transporter ATP-binding protein [SAR324 cluster bacterium]|uniref:ABC transporter ATP-binding protein n=1 Tax=SAR324 cluster bacterium TaxID=2024889 RepID=A0A2A4SWW0_9DELT|nr:MAG: ABC transporter ATP-binding protein [SAR324 cluster bacterium]
MVEIEKLAFRYGRKQLFSQLDLVIQAGGIYGLLGKNGAGKTTLLKLISGLIFPKEGSCQVMGFNPAERAPEFLQEVCFIPEEFDLPALSIQKYEALYAPFYPHFQKQEFAGYLEEFELTPDLNLSKLSYGQKKKFLISFALATLCRLVLMDEPTNGLDIPSKSKFRQILAGAATSDRSFVISTHQVRDLEQLIDPVLILDEGKILLQHSLYDISKVLNMRQQEERPQDEVLYYEKAMGGYFVLREEQKEQEHELEIDLEILFNAAIGNPQKFGEIFKRGIGHE